MKARILLFIISLSLPAFMHAQIRSNCTTPISNTFFQQKLNSINNTYDQASRYNQAMALVQANCLSSWQVKQVTISLYDDHDKMEFCKAAYLKVTDPANFYDVYDAFGFFSTVFRLHDYINSNRGTQTTTTTTTMIYNDQDLGFPSLPYPDYNQYLGTTGCPGPLAEEQFLKLAREVKNNRMNDQAKLEYAKSLVNGNCFSTAQIMKLSSLIVNENLRLDLLKTGIPRVFDRGNYGYAQYSLNNTMLRTDFTNALFGNTVTTTTTTVNCTVSQSEFDDIKKSISNTSFSSSKLTVAKQAIEAKKCFTVRQIKDIIGLFSFDDARLDIAKFAYDYCIDKSNYYQVNDSFSFSSSKDDLSNYVRSRQ